MLLLGSLVLVFGTVAVTFVQMGSTGDELRFGYEQMIHARIPWLFLAFLGVGCGLGIASVVRRRAWYKYPVVGVELMLSGLLAWYFASYSFLPPHELGVGVGDPFPTYSLPDQDGQVHTVEATVPRSPALYIFYRGDW